MTQRGSNSTFTAICATRRVALFQRGLRVARSVGGRGRCLSACLHLRTARSMLIQQLQQISDIFTKRFFFNALLPSFIFGSLSFATVIYSVSDFSKLATWWQGLDALSKLLVSIGYIAIVWFIASAVASQWRGIVRLYEGYPLKDLYMKLGRPAPGVRWHQSRLHVMWSSSLAAAFYRYPASEHESGVLPSRLGIFLLASEKYSYDRYKADAIIFWPRLFPL